MASPLKNLSDYDPSSMPDASQFRFAILCTDYHDHITGALLQGARDTLLKHGALEDRITVLPVPGAYELPAAAQFAAEAGLHDAFLCFGCVIKGETRHDDYINHAVAKGLIDLSLKYNKPFIFGLLTVENEQQAVDRAGGKHGNKGVECAVAALRMLQLKQKVGNKAKTKLGFSK